MTKDSKKHSSSEEVQMRRWWICLVVFCGILLLIPGLVLLGTGMGVPLLLTVWLVGAGALGLLSGFTTGASEKAGAASEFLKFLSAGVVIPLLGGMGTMMGQHPTTTETFQYADGQVIQHVTQSALDSAEAVLYPVGVFAGFLLVFGLFATFGIILGAKFREGGIFIKMA